MKSTSRQAISCAFRYIGVGLLLYVALVLIEWIWIMQMSTMMSKTLWLFTENHWGFFLLSLAFVLLLYRSRMRTTVDSWGADHFLMLPNATTLLKELLLNPVAARAAIAIGVCWTLFALRLIPWLGLRDAVLVVAGVNLDAHSVHQRFPLTLWEGLNTYILCLLSVALLLNGYLNHKRRYWLVATAAICVWSIFSLTKALVSDGWPLLATDVAFGSLLAALLRRSGMVNRT